MKKNLLFITILISPFTTLNTSNATLSHLQTQNQIEHKPDISIMIADLKYNKGEIKILEFGEGTKSCYKGYDNLYGEGKIWNKFWKLLGKYELPIWYIGRPPVTEQRKQKMAYKTFYKIGGMACANLIELENHSIFKKLKNYPIRNQGKNISDYNGIIIFKQYRGQKEQIKKFKSKYSNFIFIDQAVNPFVNNKFNTSKLFKKTGLNNFRPAWNVYPKLYTSTLAQKITNDLNTQTVVIKPLNSANGWGVIITNKDQLDKMLNLIINKSQQLKKHPDKTYKQWFRDRNAMFLVEQYVPSQVITIEDKEYDPTMRVVLFLEYNNQEIVMKILGTYWKLPELSLHEKGSLTKKHKSKVSKERTSSATVQKHDYLHVKDSFETFMPILYAHMLKDRGKKSNNKNV